MQVRTGGKSTVRMSAAFWLMMGAGQFESGEVDPGGRKPMMKGFKALRGCRDQRWRDGRGERSRGVVVLRLRVQGDPMATGVEVCGTGLLLRLRDSK